MLFLDISFGFCWFFILIIVYKVFAFFVWFLGFFFLFL
jgi:hypothetical protein